jgi:hypothetical protein
MKKMGRLLNHMVVQHEEGQKKQKLLLKNKKYYVDTAKQY